jgi:hypothetical protein
MTKEMPGKLVEAEGWLHEAGKAQAGSVTLGTTIIWAGCGFCWRIWSDTIRTLCEYQSFCTEKAGRMSWRKSEI